MQKNSWPALGAMIAVLLAVSGCSLFYESTRPVPDAARNLHCVLEYRPAVGGVEPSDSDTPFFDVLFMATANPYRLEEVYMNPVDMLFHGAVGPGRHLARDLTTSGVRCESQLWTKGKRLSQRFKPRRGLRCRRLGHDEVVFEVTTKYGSCRMALAEGDGAPKCKTYRFRNGQASDIGQAIDAVLNEPCNAEVAEH